MALVIRGVEGTGMLAISWVEGEVKVMLQVGEAWVRIRRWERVRRVERENIVKYEDR
jgi:hypothetical protein